LFGARSRLGEERRMVPSIASAKEGYTFNLKQGSELRMQAIK
jgi:hypothetical protein